MIETIIIKEKRNTLSLKITNNFSLLVKSPDHISNNFINSFIESKKTWIAKTIKKLKNQNKIMNVPYAINNDILFLGKRYKIIKKHTSIKTISFYNSYCSINKEPTCIHTFICSEIKKIAIEFITKRTLYISKKIKLPPKKIRIKNQKTRWGSCSSKKNINLNWKLIHAPIHVIDYVIIHELCHLEQLNHSKKFWNLVKKYSPEYPKHIKWLKENGSFIHINH